MKKVKFRITLTREGSYQVAIEGFHLTPKNGLFNKEEFDESKTWIPLTSLPSLEKAESFIQEYRKFPKYYEYEIDAK